MTLIIASSNEGKIKEFEQIFAAKPWPFAHVQSYDELIDEVELPEDGDSFLQNAAQKARSLQDILTSSFGEDFLRGKAILSDDSGLCVRALNNAPGVFSARYAGKDADMSANRAKLKEELEKKGLKSSPAEFVCALHLILPRVVGELMEFDEVQISASFAGSISCEERGQKGFGYDCMFKPAGSQKTLGEMNEKEKNAISHRAKALELLFQKLKERSCC